MSAPKVFPTRAAAHRAARKIRHWADKRVVAVMTPDREYRYLVQVRPYAGPGSDGPTDPLYLREDGCVE